MGYKVFLFKGKLLKFEKIFTDKLHDDQIQSGVLWNTAHIFFWKILYMNPEHFHFIFTCHCPSLCQRVSWLILVTGCFSMGTFPLRYHHLQWFEHLEAQLIYPAEWGRAMCRSSPHWCRVPECSLKDCMLVSNPVVLVTSSSIHHCSSKNEVFIGNTVTRTYKDIFTQKCDTKYACVCLVFLLIPKVNWMKIEFLCLLMP